MPFSSIVIRTPPISPRSFFSRSTVRSFRTRNQWTLFSAEAPTDRRTLLLFLARWNLLCVFPHFSFLLSSDIGSEERVFEGTLSDPKGFKIDRGNVILESLKTGFHRILPCKSSLFVYGAISSSIKRTYLPAVWARKTWRELNEP